MKIGILTFHCAHNYGAVLQCYGLQEYLKSLGHEVYVIDYRPSYITSHRDYVRFNPRFLLTKNIKLLPKVFWTQLKLSKYRNRRWNKFNDFITKYLNLYQIKGSNFDGHEFDLCIVGSDQVWNSRITGGKFEPLYFGVNFKCPVISYAASTIVNNFSDKEKNELSELLKNFSAASVREKKLSQQIKEFSGCEPVVVVDPTILAGKEAFISLANSKREEVKEKYILSYTIHEDPSLHAFAEKIAKAEGLQIIEIASTYTLHRYKTKLYDVSIPEFITLFRNAEYVITNSFHGTAFSLLFQKKFYTIRQNNEVDDRVESMLRQINLLDRFVQSNYDGVQSKIDYTSVEKNIWNYRQSSIAFITKELEIVKPLDNFDSKAAGVPEISVIMPVYNAELYLRESIDSVLCQSFSNFELLIVDDGSNDKSSQICDDYSRIDARVKVYHKVNEGVAIARNIGLELAKGKYVTFLDSDDMLMPDALQVLYSEMVKNPYIKFVQGAHNILDGSGGVSESRIDSIRKAYEKIILNSDDYVSKVLLNHTFSVNILFRRDFLSMYNIQYPVGLSYLEDTYFLINFFSYHPAGIYIFHPTYLYRSNVVGSATGSPITDKKIISQLRSAQLINGRVYCFSGLGFDTVNKHVHGLACNVVRLSATRAKEPEIILRECKEAFPTIKAYDTLLSSVISLTYSKFSPNLAYTILKILVKVKKLKR